MQCHIVRVNTVEVCLHLGGETADIPHFLLPTQILPCATMLVWYLLVCLKNVLKIPAKIEFVLVPQTITPQSRKLFMYGVKYVV